MKPPSTSLALIILLFAACQPGAGGEVDEDTAAGGSPPSPRPMAIAFHEQQLARGEVSHAQLHDHVVLRLESDGTHEHDTGGAGHDLVPFLYEKETEHTLCLDDNDAGHRLHLRTTDGDTLAEVPAGECITTTVPQGLHHLEIHAGSGAVGDTTLFLRPGGPEGQRLGDDYDTAEAALDGDASPPCEDCKHSALPFPYDMDHGQVAVGAAGPDANGTEFEVLAACNDGTPEGWSGGSHALLVGPRTQVVLFTEPDLGGTVELLRNENPNVPMCFDPGAHAWASFIASPLAAIDGTTCTPERPIRYCHGEVGCEAMVPDHDEIVLKDGEAAILSPVVPGQAQDADTHTCCVIGWVFSHDSGPCDDLSLLGFDDDVYNLLLGDDAILHMSRDTNQGGASLTLMRMLSFGSTLHPGSSYPVYGMPTDTPDMPGPGTVSSLHVETLTTENALTLVTTKDCEGCTLRGADLSNQDLSGAKLSNANLIEADLTYAQLTDAHLAGARLSGATCTYTNFAGADLSGTTLAGNGHDIGAAHFNSAYLADADLSGAVANGVFFQEVQFIDTGTNKSSFANAELVGARFNNAVIKGVDFDKADVTGADFSGAILLGASLTSLAVDASGSCDDPTTFSNSILYGSDFGESSFGCVDFTNAMFSFQAGYYPLEHYSGWDAKQKQYMLVTSHYAYGVTIPTLEPLATDNNTTCPDGAPGPCVGDGGESCETCPLDCDPDGIGCATQQCEMSWHCLAELWTGGDHGRFCCIDGACTAYADTTFCGDNVCDFLGGETAASCFADCHCGDGSCQPDKSETFNACPEDCTIDNASTGISLECRNGAHCVSLPWTIDGYGHWSCQDGACAATLDTATEGPLCGDGICDAEGRWVALKPPGTWVSTSAWSTQGPCGKGGWGSE